MNRQQEEILDILKARGVDGMNSYTWRTKYVQLPVRIKELKDMGYSIKSRRRRNKSVDYVLFNSPTSTDTTQPSYQPQQIQNPWDVPMESYIGKDGRTYWREITKPIQENLLEVQG